MEKIDIVNYIIEKTNKRISILYQNDPLRYQVVFINEQHRPSLPAAEYVEVGTLLFSYDLFDFDYITNNILRSEVGNAVELLNRVSGNNDVRLVILRPF